MIRYLVLAALLLACSVILVSWKLRTEQAALGFKLTYLQALKIGTFTFTGGATTGCCVGALVLLGPSYWIDDPHGVVYFITFPVAFVVTVGVFYLVAKQLHRNLLAAMKQRVR